MTLRIEDGTNVAGAQAYADSADYVAWHTAFYGSAPTGSTAEIEGAILRAVAYLNTLKWAGARTNGRGQSLAWPRTGVEDCEELAIASDEIPTELIQAQHMLTKAEIDTVGVLAPNASPFAVKREKVDVIEVEYDTGTATGGTDDARTTVTGAIDLIGCFLVSEPGTGYYFSAMVV